ncbi:MAG TPA: hypothetical protein VNZ86_08385 [Bacteroidia bacterium]|jgi:hypothetical protein|nr:hypothetical protein [Bacteroidia bacterium]
MDKYYLPGKVILMGQTCAFATIFGTPCCESNIVSLGYFYYLPFKFQRTTLNTLSCHA